MKSGLIYVASTLTNAERVVALITALRLRARCRGIAVATTYDWTKHSSGDLYVPDSDPLTKGAVAVKEFIGVVSADVLLVVMPGERGTHFEFGVAYTIGKPIVLLLDKHDGRSPSFHFLDNIVRAHDEDEAIEAVVDFLDGTRKVQISQAQRLIRQLMVN